MPTVRPLHFELGTHVIYMAKWEIMAREFLTVPYIISYIPCLRVVPTVTEVVEGDFRDDDDEQWYELFSARMFSS